MGLSLSEPVTAKETKRLENEKFKCGSSCMQGWRINMEDAHIHILSYEKHPAFGFFALFDGHGGPEVSFHITQVITDYFFNHPMLETNIPEALRATFMDTDIDVRNSIQSNSVGATGVVVVVRGDKLYCANIGDSRAIASVGGIVRELSEDHKPHGDKELQRIVKAGGYVSNYRVNGSLALSRAFGDFQYKENFSLPPEEQMVIAVPDITMVTITPEYEFFVVACDGIWDVMTSQEVVNFVRLRISKGMKPEIICEELMTNCLAPDARMGGLGCDNMSVMISCFIEGRTYEALGQSCLIPAQFHFLPPLPTASQVFPTSNPAANVRKK